MIHFMCGKILVFVPIFMSNHQNAFVNDNLAYPYS